MPRPNWGHTKIQPAEVIILNKAETPDSYHFEDTTYGNVRLCFTAEGVQVYSISMNDEFMSGLAFALSSYLQDKEVCRLTAERVMAQHGAGQAAQGSGAAVTGDGVVGGAGNGPAGNLPQSPSPATPHCYRPEVQP